jgi:hypothetical protein
MASPTVEEARALLDITFVAAAADCVTPRPAENWTSPLRQAMTPKR